MIICVMCVKEKFPNIHVLAEHLAAYHYEYTPYECYECPAKFGTAARIDHHYQCHHKMDEYSYLFRASLAAENNYLVQDDVALSVKLTHLVIEQRERGEGHPQRNFIPAEWCDEPGCLSQFPTFTTLPVVERPNLPPTLRWESDDEEEDSDRKEAIEWKEPMLQAEAKPFGPNEKAQLGLFGPVTETTMPDYLWTMDTSSAAEFDGSWMDGGALNETEMFERTLGDSQEMPESSVAAEASINVSKNHQEGVGEPSGNGLEIPTPKSKLKNKVQCLKCGEMVPGCRSGRYYHANMVHLRIPIYRCRICPKVWYTFQRQAAIMHGERKHNNSGAILNNKIERKNLRKLMESCFAKEDCPELPRRGRPIYKKEVVHMKQESAKTNGPKNGNAPLKAKKASVATRTSPRKHITAS